MKKHVDLFGEELKVGDHVIRALQHGSTPYMFVCEVTSIIDEKVYLDNSKQALHYPDRLIITTEPHMWTRTQGK